MVQELTDEEREYRALRSAVAALAGDGNFVRFRDYVATRMADYIKDMGSPVVYRSPEELNNTAGRVDELRQLLVFIEDCGEQ